METQVSLKNIIQGLDTLYLDMDEVLTDFIGGACEVHGLSREYVEEKRKPNQYPMEEILELTPDQFWEPITECGVEFWVNLKPLPHFEELISRVRYNWEKRGRDWFIVTAPSRCPYSYAGKVLWLKAHIHPHFDRIIPTRYKYKLSKPGTVLLDDHILNCFNFVKVASPGEAVLFPHVGNKLKEYADKPLEHEATSIVINRGLIN